MMFTVMESVFLFICAVNFVVPGRWAPKWYSRAVQPWAGTFFNLHGPSCALVLFFATGDNQWKFIPASILACLLYDFGFIWSAEWFGLFNTVVIAFHHAGPLIAFYYQKPEEGWLNALLYFQVWYIHGFNFLRTYLLPALFLFKVEIKKDGTVDYWLHRFYAVMTPVVYAFYVQYLPVGLNYATIALFLQVSGRYSAAANIVKISWMRRIETPGVIGVFFYSYGGFKVAVPVLIAYIAAAYFFIERPGKDQGCQKLVLTDEIRDFMRTFPDEEPLDEKAVEEKTSWWESQPWAKSYPLFRAVMLRENEKVTQLLKEGADHSQVHGDWWHSIPMQWACSGGGVSTMKILIEAGANPFHAGVRDGTFMFKQEYSRKFYDELQVLAKKDEETVSRVNVEFLESPVSFVDAQNLAKSKGGRLVTSQEAKVVLAHAENKSVDGDDIDKATCFATTDDSPTTFACKLVKTPTIIVSGEACAEVSKTCSLFMWIVPKEEEPPKVETKEEKGITESLKEKAA